MLKEGFEGFAPLPFFVQLVSSLIIVSFTTVVCWFKRYIHILVQFMTLLTSTANKSLETFNDLFKNIFSGNCLIISNSQ